jgi:hypothetical protein
MIPTIKSSKRKRPSLQEIEETEPLVDHPNTSHVTIISSYDVLLGKGPASHRNPGNVRFRQIIRSRQTEYTETNRRRSKDVIARQIMASVTSKGGKFLKHDDTNDIGSDNSLTTRNWTVIDDAAALEKVKQALRDCNARQRSLPIVSDDHNQQQKQQQQQQSSLQGTSSIVSDVQQASTTQVMTQHNVLINQRDTRQNDAQPWLINQLLLRNLTTQLPLPVSEYSELNLGIRIAATNPQTNPSGYLNLVQQPINVPPPQALLNLRLQNMLQSNGTNSSFRTVADTIQLLQSQLTNSNRNNLDSTRSLLSSIIQNIERIGTAQSSERDREREIFSSFLRDRSKRN